MSPEKKYKIYKNERVTTAKPDYRYRFEGDKIK
jgi:hypothetical protein